MRSPDGFKLRKSCPRLFLGFSYARSGEFAVSHEQTFARAQAPKLAHPIQKQYGIFKIANAERQNQRQAALLVMYPALGIELGVIFGGQIFDNVIQRGPDLERNVAAARIANVQGRLALGVQLQVFLRLY